MAIKISGNTVIDDSQNITATGSATIDGPISLGSVALPSAGTARIYSRDTDNSLYLQTSSGNRISLLDGSQNSMTSFEPTTLKFFISNTERVRLDSSGNLKIGGTLSSTPNISLNEDGSATFTSTNPVVTDQPSTGNIANPAIQIKHDGTINGSWRHDGRFEVGGQDANAVITLSPDGSASFDGEINIGGYDGSSTTTDGVLLGAVGGVYSQLAAATAATGVVFQGMHGATFTSRITADGSATFAGGGAAINSYGQLVITRSDSNAYPSLTINSAGTTTNTIDLNGDGSATFAGTITANGGVSFTAGELVESVNVTAGTLASASDIDLSTGMVHYFTTQESTQVTPNLMVSGKSVNQIMAVGEAISVVILLTASASGYMSSLTIDGSPVTPMWGSGIAPSEGGASGIDVYTLQVIKTANSTYTVIANSSNFA